MYYSNNLKKITYFFVFSFIIITFSVFLSGCAAKPKPKHVYSLKYYKSHIKKAKAEVFSCNQTLVAAIAPHIPKKPMRWKKNIGDNFRHLADLYGTLLEPVQTYRNIITGGGYSFKNCINALSVLYHKSKGIYKKQHPSMF
ncbi:MAG: hypothetical protein EVG15_08550 [Candidatus Acididesulfobacter diazotrophicus]|jgi:hypothetical protein|uniref:Uncharacterized protein n=1 Tax=Candidatus Acididesulfobacter diazotrophicus TaxID=2597226 RepID=A0A519BKW6_9DELT|nr:MAG: hypothetical protein EVG15_08550 [Candidatus Acididesulfobacter diazotrophicus]